MLLYRTARNKHLERFLHCSRFETTPPTSFARSSSNARQSCARLPKPAAAIEELLERSAECDRVRR
jgi:hypothetical protein